MQRKLKICVVNDHFSYGPGGQHRIQNIGIALEKLDHEVTYVCPYGISNNIADLALTYDKLQQSVSTKYFYPILNDFFGIFRNLAKLREKPDLIIVELPYTSMKAWSALYARLRSVQTIFDYADLWMSLWNKPFREQPGFSLKCAYRVGSIFEDSNVIITSRMASILTAISSPLGYLLGKLTRRKVHVLLQPVDTRELFNPDKVINENNNYISRLLERCNAERFIMLGIKHDNEWIISETSKIVRELRDEHACILVAGSFPRAQELSKRKGLDKNICFLGKIPHALMPFILKLVDFSLVITSPHIKSLKYTTYNITKVAEYLAMGKPVIADSINLIDYVINGYNGFIVKDLGQLREKVLLLLNDQKMLRQMSANARKLANEKLDSIKVASKLVELYKVYLTRESNKIN